MLIDKDNQKRIQNDAGIAIDALMALRDCPTLDSSYIQEKSERAQRCLDFIKSFGKEY